MRESAFCKGQKSLHGHFDGHPSPFSCAVDDELARLYPDARCSLIHDGPFQLLVATVLSAQTTDVRVNSLTPALFARYPDAAALAGAEERALEEELRPLGMQRTRARRLIALGAALVDSCDGVVPATRDELVALPGVGRKTANVVLGNAFGVPAITVDTHVGRLARRLGWTSAKDPLAVERDIAALWEPRRWTDGCHRLIEHGRAVCVIMAAFPLFYSKDGLIMKHIQRASVTFAVTCGPTGTSSAGGS